MANHPRAGQPPCQSDLINIAQLTSQYYVFTPEPNNRDQAVKFGTSGHRGSAKRYSYNETHILAISQSIVEQRKKLGIIGPCYVGKDTHALSEPAFISVLEVLTANCVEVIVQLDNGYTPTPVISNAILTHNLNSNIKADGIIITSSHNSPEDGGIKYNLPNGGPANIKLTTLIQDRANALIQNNLRGIKRLTFKKALQSGYIHEHQFVQSYVNKLTSIIDIPAIQQSGIKIGVDPLGGSGISYWQYIAENYNLDLTLINDQIDQTFRFMRIDHDGLIRIDCSSEFAIANLSPLHNKFDLLFTSDPDHDRHGIITPDGLMDTNHYLVSAINYLFQHRSRWNDRVGVGKTIVSSTMIDRVTNSLGRRLVEVPVGFKWFVDGLYNGSLGFGGEESSGGSFLCFDGSPWSTDKDGMIMCLLAAEITAVTGKNPQQHYNELINCFGCHSYSRIQFPANDSQKLILSKLSSDLVTAHTLCGDPIISVLTTAQGNNSAIGGIKLMTKNGWFAVRPSGTEPAYKIYCESFLCSKHRQQIEKEAIDIISGIIDFSGC